MARDPYQYYRVEAREILDGLSKGLLDLEQNRASHELIQHLLRLAHTLKGAARVVKLATSAEAAHRFEELLAPYRDNPAPPRETVRELLGLTESLKAQLEAVAAPAADPTVAPGPHEPAAPVVSEERFQSVRVDIGEMDRLLQGVSEVGVQAAALRRGVRELDHSRLMVASLAEQLAPRVGSAGRRAMTPAAQARAHALVEQIQGALDQTQRSLAGGLDRAEAELQQVRDKANTLRLLPAGTVFGMLEFAVHDAARSQGKTVRFEASGGEHCLDGHVLAPLYDALLHLVRNAADHGIESPSARKAAGKPAAGRIELQVERRGSRVVFRCRDDGRGLDLDAIRRAAVHSGKIAPPQAAALDLDGAVRLLLGGGISTTARVTEISGRGIGLDVVRDVAARLKGTVALHSERGQGTTVELSAPSSLTSLSALVVEAGGITASLPLEAVRRALRIAQADIARTAEGAAIFYDGQMIPYIALGDILGGSAGPVEGPTAARPFRTTLIVESRLGRGGIGVDRLLRQAEVVVRPLPRVIGRIAIVTGSAFDADGNPEPVLDPEGLVEAARTPRGLTRAPAPPPRSRLLVVDDSLTTRMLVKSILESAGYEVALATSGEEGLAVARAGDYRLFLVDIEMPGGMNGFDFLAQARSDPKLRDTPSILVSSRGTAEDRQRGAELGARAYIVKGEFEQGRFLQTIRELDGAR